MTGSRFCLFILLGIWIAAFPASAQDEAPPELLTRLSENVGGISTLETSFVQEKQLAILRQAILIRGKVYMTKPERLAWHVSEPIRYSMIMDGKSIRQWDADSGQESRISLDANPAVQMAADQMRRWFSGDYLRLRNEYRITLDQTEPIMLTFVPLRENPASGYVERVTVLFTEDERYIASITIVEKGGDRTAIRFHDTKLEQPIPDSAWDLRSAAHK